MAPAQPSMTPVSITSTSTSEAVLRATRLSPVGSPPQSSTTDPTSPSPAVSFRERLRPSWTRHP
jgi:hypothetical protein